jgi:nucleoside-diphosphate-sugar epimerase
MSISSSRDVTPPDVHPPRPRIDDLVPARRGQLRGTLNVLKAARKVGARVNFACFSSVYGYQERFPVTEDMEPRPCSPYAATKLPGEANARMAQLRSSHDFAALHQRVRSGARSGE